MFGLLLVHEVCFLPAFVCPELTVSKTLSTMVTPCEIGPSVYDKSPQEAQQGVPHPRISLLGSLKFSSSSALGTLPLTSLREYPRYC